MNILEKKKLLERRKIGLVNFYTPTCKREDVVKAEMSNMLSRMFNGSITALASSLLSMENVTMQEIEYLKKLISEKEKKLRGKKNE
jgi:predicted transcriptional regulator